MKGSRLFVVVSLLAWCATGNAATDAFEASPAWPAQFVARIKPATVGTDVLRRLTVEERVGERRTDELVRVPLFLHGDEPNDPADWAVVRDNDDKRNNPLPIQIDDIRRDESGKLTRCHLYFPTSLAAWERQTFLLVRRTADTPKPSAAGQATTCRKLGNRVELAGADLTVAFAVDGKRPGSIVGIKSLGRDLDLPDGWIAPKLTLVRQAADCSTIRKTSLSYSDPDRIEVRDMRWAAGALFAKFVVRVGPRDVPDSVEFTYRIPFRGAVICQTERIAPEGGPNAEVVGVADHLMLAGKLRLGKGATGPEVRRIPTGLRRLTRATLGHHLDVLADPVAGMSLVSVPNVQTGGGDIDLGLRDSIAVAGSEGFHRAPPSNSATLRAFWGEMHYAFLNRTDTESLWQLTRRQYQPLVAIVDEPDIGPEDIRAGMPRVAQRFSEIKHWGKNWIQEASISWLGRDRKRFDGLLAKRPTEAESTVERHLPGWARVKPPLPRNPKDQGLVDPYHLAYGSSVLPFLQILAPQAPIPRYTRSVALAARQVHGRVDAAGFPYIDCFNTAFNMQLGPLGLALVAGSTTPDAELARWAIDGMHSPAVTAIYGHGQRPYPGQIRRAEASDLLYEQICELQLRSLELSTGTDLWLHPAALGRYFDCVDVTADLQHRPVDPAAPAGWQRANFFRGQSHDHRWEGWSCAPLVGIFSHRADCRRIGSTEAAYWVDFSGARSQPWAELMWFAHTDLLLELGGSLPSPKPASVTRPQKVEVERSWGGNRLNWPAVSGAIGYRVYRADKDGGPWTWLNSPYRQPPAPPLTDTRYTDNSGAKDAQYLVTAVDSEGRESRWYDDEPADN